MSAKKCAMCGANVTGIVDNDPYAQVRYYEYLCAGCSRKVSTPIRNHTRIEADGELDLLALEMAHPVGQLRSVDVLIDAQQARTMA